VPLPQNLLTNTVDSAVDHGIRISWTVKEPEFVFKTRIYRAENERGPYRLYTELPVTVNLFIDQRIEPAKFYYYHLTLVGLMGEESASTINFPGVYYSTLPAGIPSVLKYQPLANGVSLRFVSNDREVTGYRVYRCQGFRGVLQQISPFIPAPVAGEVIQFTDSSSGLSGKQTYGYAIRAENSSHLLSGFSDTVYARPLIVTIPPAPVNVAVIHTGVSNKIFWQDMRMQEPIVVGYNIFRATPHASGFQQINRGLIPASSNSYLDSLTDKNSDYTYYVQSVDGFGGLSRGSSVTGGTASAQAHETIPSPQGLSGYITAIGVQLEWMPMNLPSLNAFRLYRYRRGETALLLTTVNKQSNLQYLDKTIEGGSLYFYYLVAVDDAGSTSDKGNEVSIRAEK
jgi:hypothetical protein